MDNSKTNTVAVIFGSTDDFNLRFSKYNEDAFIVERTDNNEGVTGDYAIINRHSWELIKSFIDGLLNP